MTLGYSVQHLLSSSQALLAVAMLAGRDQLAREGRMLVMVDAVILQASNLRVGFAELRRELPDIGLRLAVLVVRIVELVDRFPDLLSSL